MNKRIWELDALRGVGIWAVVVLHLMYDLQLPVLQTLALRIIMTAGGLLFVILSGLCVTLGSHSVRRGTVLLVCAMGITLVTRLLAPLDVLPIRFGVLHLLGTCMLLWPAFRRLPKPALPVLGVVFTALGYYMNTLRVQTPWLFPLGLMTKTFVSGDYYPLFPHLGWFLLGAWAGRTFYQAKTTRLPRFPADAAPVRFFRWCGRQSLWIYLLHQPVIYGFFWLVGQMS